MLLYQNSQSIIAIKQIAKRLKSLRKKLTYRVSWIKLGWVCHNTSHSHPCLVHYTAEY